MGSTKKINRERLTIYVVDGEAALRPERACGDALGAGEKCWWGPRGQSGVDPADQQVTLGIRHRTTGRISAPSAGPGWPVGPA